MLQLAKNDIQINVWWEVLVLTLSLNSQEGDTLSKKKSTLKWMFRVGLRAGLSKSEHFPSSAAKWQFQQEQAKPQQPVPCKGPALPWRNAGLSPICHRLPMWLAAQLFARDAAVPYLQGYFKNEHFEDRTSQTISLALDTVLPEQTWVIAEEWRWKLAFCKIRG